MGIPIKYLFTIDMMDSWLKENTKPFNVFENLNIFLKYEQNGCGAVEQLFKIATRGKLYDS